MEKKVCIVVKNNQFEAVYYEGNNRPLNCILVAPDGTTWRNEYHLINTGLDVSWKDHYNPRLYKVLTVTYDGTLLFEKRTVSNPQLVIDVLNKYKDMSPSQLEALALESQEKEKTALEICIEELKAEKDKLEKQIKIYRQIRAKKEEIKQLLNQLED